MFGWIRSLLSPKRVPMQRMQGQVTVSADDHGVQVTQADHTQTVVPWAELRGVAIETTDQGPFVNDVWWHLATADAMVVYPNDAQGVGEVLERLQQLPAFDNEQLMRSMASADNQIFVLWRATT